ncbi:MAG TPA: hypothetical protein VLL50_02970 [Usitatibacter sp.]|nr:hypothetical protein [Usitatibacter sp.]
MLVLGDVVRVEGVARVEVPRDHQRIALHAAMACVGEPILAALLHQLDELVLALGKVAAKGLALVRRVDGDGADGLFLGVRGGDECERGEEQQDETGHGPILVVAQR